MDTQKYEYAVIRVKPEEDVKGRIQAYARKGWRLHTYTEAALESGAFGTSFSRAYGEVGLDLVNVITIVFEKEYLPEDKKHE